MCTKDIGGPPADFYYGLALVLVFAYVLWATPLGRHMRFAGASREVSRLSGVRVDRIRLGAFTFAGLLSGVGGVIAAAALSGYDATTADSFLLPTFAAVFLSTAILEPGRFNPLGTLVGIFFLAADIPGLADALQESSSVDAEERRRSGHRSPQVADATRTPAQSFPRHR